MVVATLDFLDDGTMRISREAAYQAFHVQGWGTSHVGPETMASQRPAEVADRAVPAKPRSGLRGFTTLLHLLRMDGRSGELQARNGPAAGRGAEAVCDATARAVTSLPGQLRRSLTRSQGADLAQYVRLQIGTGVAVCFCDLHTPWQRGTNENASELLRQQRPEGRRFTPI